MRAQRVWFLSDVFYPETEGVAYFVTRIATALANRFDVRVVCAQPVYSVQGTVCQSNESREGVTIHRCWSTRFNRQSLIGRICNNGTFCLALLFHLLWHLRAGDCVIATSSPPMVPFVAAIVCRLRRAKCILRVYDVYPDIAIVAGVLKQGSVAAKILHRLQRYLWRNADCILTVGRDMQSLIRGRINCSCRKVKVIPLFSSTDEIFPEPRAENTILRDNGLLGSFVVQVAGNVGPVHNVEALMESARSLEDTPDIKFLIIGSGKKMPWIDDVVRREERKNIIVLPRMPRNESCNILNACDIAISALFVPGIWGLANPSRTYGIMAAGKPMIAMADDEIEVALLIAEQQIGWRVRPDDVEGLTKAIRDAYDRRDDLAKMGERARHVAETSYSIDEIVSMYASVLCSELPAERHPVAVTHRVSVQRVKGSACGGGQKLADESMPQRPVFLVDESDRTGGKSPVRAIEDAPGIVEIGTAAKNADQTKVLR